MSNANPFPNAVPGPYKNADNLDPLMRLPRVGDNFDGRVKVDTVKYITSRDGSQFTIAEFTILTSNKAEVPVGGRYSWMQGHREAGTAINALLVFLYACMGLVPGRDQVVIDERIKPNQTNYLNNMVSTAQPCTGCEVMLSTRGIITQKKKEAFTVHNWSAAPAAPAQA